MLPSHDEVGREKGVYEFVNVSKLEKFNFSQFSIGLSKNPIVSQYQNSKKISNSFSKAPWNWPESFKKIPTLRRNQSNVNS